MPIYEYRCRKCRRVSSVITTRISEKVDAACEHCGSKSMERLMSRFAMPKSEQARLDRLGDSALSGGFDENDPKSVASYMRKMGREMGDEMNDPEFDEAVDEIERGAISGDADDSSDDDL